jgi:hypothetical protein
MRSVLAVLCCVAPSCSTFESRAIAVCARKARCVRHVEFHFNAVFHPFSVQQLQAKQMTEERDVLRRVKDRSEESQVSILTFCTCCQLQRSGRLVCTARCWPCLQIGMRSLFRTHLAVLFCACVQSLLRAKDEQIAAVLKCVLFFDLC